jgi:hypothetical protein
MDFASKTWFGNDLNSTSAFKRHWNEIRTKFWIKKQPQARVGEKTTNCNSKIFLEQGRSTQVGLWAADQLFHIIWAKWPFCQNPEEKWSKLRFFFKFWTQFGPHKNISGCKLDALVLDTIWKLLSKFLQKLLKSLLQMLNFWRKLKNIRWCDLGWSLTSGTYEFQHKNFSSIFLEFLMK